MTTISRPALTGTGAYGHQSYAQWVRWAIGLARNGSTKAISLFESSVPEPRELLRQTTARMIEPEFGPSFVSAFGGGNPLVLEILAQRYGVTRAQVLGTTGATGALSLIYRAFARPGEHVLIETPGFDLFHDLAFDRGLRVSTFRRTGPRQSIDPTEVEKRMQADTRLIVLSNLHNPSGMAIDREVFDALTDLAERRGVLLVVDEVYADYAGDAIAPPAVTLSPAALSVSSITKFFGLAALRCGWIVGAPSTMTMLRDYASRIDFGISNLSHAVAAEVLRDPAPYRAHTDATLAAARPVITRWVDEMSAEGLIDGELPSAGCIYFPRLIGVVDTEAFATTLIQRHGVIVAPGEYFGASGHIRIGFGLPAEKLAAGLRLLADELRVSARPIGRVA